jgi:hypothetical protein
VAHQSFLLFIFKKKTEIFFKIVSSFRKKKKKKKKKNLKFQREMLGARLLQIFVA